MHLFFSFEGQWVGLCGESLGGESCATLKQDEANRTDLRGEEQVETFQLEHTDLGDSSRVVSTNRFFMSARGWATDSRC